MRGDFLYLEFNCRSEVEVINNKFSQGMFVLAYIYFLMIICIVIFIITIVKSIVECLITLRKIEKKAKDLEKNYGVNNTNNIIQMNQQNEIIVSEGRIIYIFPKSNLTNNKINKSNHDINQSSYG